MTTESKDQASNLSADGAILLLEELAGMTSAGVEWTIGLDGLSRDAEPRVAYTAAKLRDELRHGGNGQKLLSELGSQIGVPMEHLLAIAARATEPAKALNGLVSVTKKATHRRRAMRLAMMYPVLALVVSMIIFGAGWWGSTNPQSFSPALALSELSQDSLQTIDWWYVPMAIGFSLSAITIFVATFAKSLRPDHWSRMAWFVDLLALQIDSGEPLPDALDRSSSIAFRAPQRLAAQQWTDAIRRGETLKKSDYVPGLLGWTLASPPTQPGEFAVALRRLVSLYEERADWLQAFWRHLLPGVVLCCTIGSMAISYLLLTIVPIYGLASAAMRL